HYDEVVTIIRSRTNKPAEGLVLSRENDVIIPASGETKEDIATASCVLKGGVALGGDLNIIRSTANGVFLSYFLNNVKKYEISKLAQGISVVHLYPGQLKTLKITLPGLQEQRKIGDALSSLDALIAVEGKRITALKDHKKGLMQGLFPGNL
ncbi:MAG: restriction endonuclease subunit S, partial [Sphingobacteriales bacterium]